MEVYGSVYLPLTAVVIVVSEQQRVILPLPCSTLIGTKRPKCRE